jgi:hypothetical protein
MEVSGQLHAPAALPPGKNSWYPLDRRLDGPQSRSGRGGEGKYSEPLPGIELPDRQFRSLMAWYLGILLWRKLLNEELLNLYSSPDYINIIK